jgi:hypothetical protein
MEKYGLLGAHSIGIIRKRIVPMKLLNPSDNTVLIHRGAQLATLSMVDLDAKMSEDNFLVVDDEGIGAGDMTPVASKLAEIVDKSNLSADDKKDLANLLSQYSDVFAENILELGEAEGIECEIEMTSDDVVRKRPYHVPYALRDVINAQLEK